MYSLIRFRDAGAVEILYLSENGVRVLYGNYAYGSLDLDDVIQKLPMLECLDSRGNFEPPYPFGGKLCIPFGWAYLYMGAMNHLYVREEICDRAEDFINEILKSRQSWLVFDAVSWFCGAK